MMSVLLELRYWLELYNNPSIKRDENGFRGAEQLFVPAQHMRIREKEHYVDNAVIEGSDALRTPTMDQRNMLQQHVGRQEQSFADEFFQMSDVARKDLQAGHVVPGTPNKQDPKPPLTTPEKPPKPVNLVRDRPTLNRMIDTNINKLSGDMKKSLGFYEPVMEKWRNHPSQLKAKDRAALQFLRTVQKRREILAQVTGQPELIEAVAEEANTAAPGSPKSAMTGQDDAAIKDCCAAKRNRTFKELMETDSLQDHKCWDGELADLMCLEDMRQLKDKVLDVNTAEAFLQCKQQWTKAEKAAKQLTASFKSAVDDLQKHLKSVIAEDTRAKKREANQKEKEELRKVKQDAQLAAADIKKRKLQADENKCTLFSADFKNVPKVDIIKEDNIANMDGNAWAKPWFMEQCASLDLTLIETPVQRSLAQWGAQCKKAQATVTFPAQEKHGKEELLALFQKLHPETMRVDVSSVPGGASFSTQCWMYGCVSALKSLATLPNHACLVKAQVAGDVFHVMFQLESLLALFYRKKIIADQHDLMKSIEHLQTLKEEDLDALMRDGARIVQATLKPRQVLYVPTGWLLMEMALPSVHLYGIRKSLFLSPLVKEYGHAIEMSKAGGKNVDRMLTIKKLMEEKAAA